MLFIDKCKASSYSHQNNSVPETYTAIYFESDILKGITVQKTGMQRS